jgi:small-conductance mechanosensitive channel
MLWDQVAAAGPAGVILVGAAVALSVIPLLRWLAPHPRRHGGRPARFFLGLAALLALGALGLGTMGAASPGNVLQLFGLLALAIGLVGVGGLLAFDVVLPRLWIDVPSIVRDLILVTIAVAIGMGFLRLAGLDVFSLVTTSAVLTAVIGLALQSTIANVFSGLGLQLDRTLRHGEWIEVGAHKGRILEIGWRATRIDTEDGDTIFVPNSELVSKEVRSFGRLAGAHRMTIRIGLHRRHPPNEVRRALLAAVRGTPGVADRPEAECGPVEFDDDAVIYALRYWITDLAHDSTIDEEVHARLWYAAQRAGLEMPSPSCTLLTAGGAASARATAEAEVEGGALRLLESAEPFDGLDAESRHRCARGARRLLFARGEDLPGSEDPEGGVYVIESGAVRVHRSSNGAMREVARLGGGALLGRTLVPDHDRCTAESDVVVYRIGARELGEALAAAPQLGAGLAVLAAARRAAAGTADEAAAAPERRAPRLRRLFRR